MKTRPLNEREHGAVLVTTLIVVAVLAVAAAALVQTTLIDRVTSRSFANYYRAQMAAEAGLGEALALMGVAIRDFGYISGSQPAEGGRYRTFVQSRSVSGGVWRLEGEKIFLDSGSPAESGLLVSGVAPLQGVTVAVQFKDLSSSAAGSTRYAFWVDEAGAKQNLNWWGGPPADRQLLTNATNIPLVLPAPDGRSAQDMPQRVLELLRSVRTFQTNAIALGGTNFTSVTASNRLPTVASMNLLDEAVQGGATRYFYTLRNPAGAAAPTGDMRLNLYGLRRHLANVSSTSQETNNARAQLVEQLLQRNPPQAADWGGGDLNWLSAVGKYSTNEQKQIVANLIDYLDDDLIPTTDSPTAPTYFGVESKTLSDGRVRGHPYLNFVTTGLVFNRSSASGFVGAINSTRVLAAVGLAYPWGGPAATADYTPEISITMLGEVTEGAILGRLAENYFTKALTDQISSRPVAQFSSFSGFLFPSPVSGSANYATPFYTWPERGPTNITFTGLQWRIDALRLRYLDEQGRSGYVQVVPTNMVITLPEDPFLPAGAPGSLVIKFTEANYAEIENLYLAADPRLGHLPSSWIRVASTGGRDTNIPPPREGGAISVTNGVGLEWDTLQGMDGGFSWYASQAVTNHFSRSSFTNFQSVGELGYLWTGKPWQTLNVGRIRNPQTDDWNLLDYVQAGRIEGAALLGVLPLASAYQAGPALTLSNSLVADGGFNVNTRKLATLAAVLTNAPGLDERAAEIFASAPAANQASSFGQLASMPELVPAASQDLKFAREAVTRALGNVAVNQSRVFTIYSSGEFRQGNLVTRSTIEADVFVDLDRESGEPRLKVIGKFYR